MPKGAPGKGFSFHGLSSAPGIAARSSDLDKVGVAVLLLLRQHQSYFVPLIHTTSGFVMRGGESGLLTSSTVDLQMPVVSASGRARIVTASSVSTHTQSIILPSAAQNAAILWPLGGIPVSLLTPIACDRLGRPHAESWSMRRCQRHRRTTFGINNHDSR